MKGLALLLALAAASGASAQTPAPNPMMQARPVATIDFYGHGSIDADALRKALPIHEGDQISPEDGAKLTPRIKAAAQSIMPRLANARLQGVCCAVNGGMHLFVGLEEGVSPPSHFRPAPTGDAKLPPDLVAADAALQSALFKAVSEGHSGEDDSQGHNLSTEVPALRLLQERQVALAAGHLDLLRQVLRESADGEKRAMAARFLGYAPDMQAVVDDLVQAVSDPHPGVRNDAVRALVVFSRAKTPPRIPYAQFVDLLDTPVWTDLNKSSLALMALGKSRDPELLSQLRKQSVPTLLLMARWHDREHSMPAYWMLGEIGGLPDKAIQDAWDKADPEPVIRAALGPGPTASNPGSR